jgi:hypothetical protein
MSIKPSSSHLDIKSTRDACGGSMVLSADGRTTLWAASLLHGHAALANCELQSVIYLDLLKRM